MRARQHNNILERTSQRVILLMGGVLAPTQLATKQKKRRQPHWLPSGELAGARTQDPNIKSVVLYLLSYEFIVPTQAKLVFGGANVGNIFVLSKKISLFSLPSPFFH